MNSLNRLSDEELLTRLKTLAREAWTVIPWAAPWARMLFLHYWGIGSTADLARGSRWLWISPGGVRGSDSVRMPVMSIRVVRM